MEPDQPGKEPSRTPKKSSPRKSNKALFDLDTLYRSSEFQSRERPEVTEARLREEGKTADHKR
jgi:hypothetical protein